MHLQQYILLTVENVTNSAKLVVLPFMRYRDNVTAAMMDMAYLPQLTRCGKTFRVS